MFCANCGADEQAPETYCRRCGYFQPDYDKLAARETSASTHWRANMTLTVMTGVASLVLSLILFATFLPLPATPIVIYITAGFLVAMFAWQAQVFVRNLKLRKHLPSPETERRGLAGGGVKALPERDNLTVGDFRRRETNKLPIERED